MSQHGVLAARRQVRVDEFAAESCLSPEPGPAEPIRGPTRSRSVPKALSVPAGESDRAFESSAAQEAERAGRRLSGCVAISTPRLRPPRPLPRPETEKHLDLEPLPRGLADLAAAERTARPGGAVARDARTLIQRLIARSRRAVAEGRIAWELYSLAEASRTRERPSVAAPPPGGSALAREPRGSLRDDAAKQIRAARIEAHGRETAPIGGILAARREQTPSSLATTRWPAL